jgi:hypothetical protein
MWANFHYSKTKLTKLFCKSKPHEKFQASVLHGEAQCTKSQEWLENVKFMHLNASLVFLKIIF